MSLRDAAQLIKSHFVLFSPMELERNGSLDAFSSSKELEKNEVSNDVQVFLQ